MTVQQSQYGEGRNVPTGFRVVRIRGQDGMVLENNAFKSHAKPKHSLHCLSMAAMHLNHLAS